MDFKRGMCMGVMGLAFARVAFAQQPIEPVGRSALVSVFADDEEAVRFERRYRPFGADLDVGTSPGSVATAELMSGPTGPLSFVVDAMLEARATTGGTPDGRASTFATENLVFVVDVATPFTLAAIYGRSDVVGAAANSGTIRLTVEGEGDITLGSGSSVDEVVLRTSDVTTGETAAGELMPGVYRLRVDFSSNAAAIGGDAAAEFQAQAYFATTCRADVTADGLLNLFDFLDFQVLLSNENPRADFTGDGIFDLFDFLAFFQAFQDGC